MFCTVCAAPNPPTAHRCSACGASLRRASNPARVTLPPSNSNRHTLYAVYVMPVVVLLILAGSGFYRYRADQANAADAYARGRSALAAGAYPAAISDFASAGDYQDAEAQRATAVAKLEPYRVAYLNGIAALEAGRYDDAITSLQSVVADLPNYEDAPTLLKRAHQQRDDQLRQQAATAAGAHDWLAADRALTTLLAEHPNDTTIAAQLTGLRQKHAPILFSNNGSIYVIGPDKQDQRLVTDQIIATFPTWSPDRSKIAFLSPQADDTSGRVELYVIDVDGGNQVRLAQDVALDGWPVWSPKGDKIAFTAYTSSESSGRRREPTTIRAVDLATRRITDVTDSAQPYVSSPTWSPDGSQLAYINRTNERSNTNGSSYRQTGDVYIVTFGTHTRVNITNDQLPDANRVAWSPSGTELAIYASDRSRPWYEQANSGISLFDLSTNSLTHIETPYSSPGLPYWSPDGTALAFSEGYHTVRIHWLDGTDRVVYVNQLLSSIVTWSLTSDALLAIPDDPSQPTALITLTPNHTANLPTDLKLSYDLSSPWLGPPQWSPINLGDG
jgi:tetratricopeptide (TPR) repeat protein